MTYQVKLNPLKPFSRGVSIIGIGATPFMITKEDPELDGIWDGEMFGIIKEIEYPRRLVYTLRELSWDSTWYDSLVTWTLKEDHLGTELSLVHTGLPTRKIRETHNDGWGEYFLGPLKAYLE